MGKKELKEKGNREPRELYNTTKALALSLPTSGVQSKMLEKGEISHMGKGTDDKIVISSCSDDCGGKCFLKVHVKDGVIRAITTDDGKEPQIRACPKGYLKHKMVYHPDRLRYPLKRVGERGEGKFKRISWEEALDLVAEELTRVKKEYGVKSIFSANWSGSIISLLHATFTGCTCRFFNMFSDDGLGATKYGTSISGEGGNFASKNMYGGGFWVSDANEPDDYPNSKLLILWGMNPAESIQGTNTSWWIAQAKEGGTRVIVVDPFYSNTAATFADQWIPIRPSTDAAMFIAMAYVIITENLQDQAFLDKYTVGFKEYKDYVLGVADGEPKTPAWAEKITGVSAETIVNLAREYATTKPAALLQGMAPGKTALGEEYHRTGVVLQAMTGNIGIHGGSSATFGTGGFFELFMSGGIPSRPNPDDPTEMMFGAYDHYKFHQELGGVVPYIKAGQWPDAVLKGKNGGYPADIKMVYIVGHNLINQCQNTRKGIEALKQVDSVICHELFMTPTAKFADIVLPVAYEFERNDMHPPWLKGMYIIYSNKVVEPPYECKPDLEIFSEIAKRLNIDGYNPYTEEEWLRSFTEKSPIPDYDEFKKNGIWRPPDYNEPHVAFKKEIQDPENHPFNTPSGKIEIYVKGLEGLDFEKTFYKEYISPLPNYTDPPEGPNDPLAKKYPLQIITPHHKFRTHSTWDNVPHLRALYEHDVEINPNDAQLRGINHGDYVKIFNDRGIIVLKANLTERMMPGVIRANQGMWYEPDENGIDRGGCVNVLINDRPSPAGAQNYNTCLVQIEKE